MSEKKLLTLAEYAAQIGRAEPSVRQKCQRGTLPGAQKIGRDWLIPEGTPYRDSRIKTGQYKNWRKRNPAE